MVSVPDWIFDGDDIRLLTRTAYGGAENYHNSNSITFTRIGISGIHSLTANRKHR